MSIALIDEAISALLRQGLKRADEFGSYEYYARVNHLMIRLQGAAVWGRETHARLVSHALNRLTTAERRQQVERQARVERRGDTATQTRSNPTFVFWHDTGNGPALLLLNGWSASGLAWPSAWIARLERRFRVIRVDNRGSGWSRTAPAPFTIADLADDAAAVLQAIGATSATVAGLSMGGMVAQELAIRHPQLVDRLILLSTRPPAPHHILPARDAVEPVLVGPAPGESLADYLRAVWSLQCGRGFAERHPDFIDELVGQITERPTPRAGLFNQLRAITAWSGSARLASISAPTVVVHGADDRLMPIGNGIRLARLIPEARYVELAGVGHMTPLEAPHAVAEVLENEFTPSLPGSAGSALVQRGSSRTDGASQRAARSRT